MILFRQIKEVLVRIMVLILTTIVAGILFFRADKMTTEYLNYSHYEMVHLYSQMRIEQTIQPSQNFLGSISIYCANIEADMGVLRVEIKEENGEVIYQKEIDADILETGEFNRFTVNKMVRTDRNYVLSLEFRGNSEEDIFLGLMAVPGEMNLVQNGECSFEGLEPGYSLAIVYEMEKMPPGIAIVILFVFIVMINIFIIPAIEKMELVRKIKNRFHEVVLNRFCNRFLHKREIK